MTGLLGREGGNGFKTKATLAVTSRQPTLHANVLILKDSLLTVEGSDVSKL